MAELTVRAPAKINLHLEVLGLRPDGYHELAMVMQTLDLEDRLLLAPRDDGRLVLQSDNADLPCDGSNLILRAAEALRGAAARPGLGATIQLEKRIPIGAGLAGGSSDAAAALVGLNVLWGLDLEPESLESLAAALGSDVPYCLRGGTQLCFGRGERMEAVSLPAPPSVGVLLLKHPQVSVSTPWAYGRCRERRRDQYLAGEEASKTAATPCAGPPCCGPWQVGAPGRRCATTSRPWWNPRWPASARGSSCCAERRAHWRWP